MQRVLLVGEGEKEKIRILLSHLLLSDILQS